MCVVPALAGRMLGVSKKTGTIGGLLTGGVPGALIGNAIGKKKDKADPPANTSSMF